MHIRQEDVKNMHFSLDGSGMLCSSSAANDRIHANINGMWNSVNNYSTCSLIKEWNSCGALSTHPAEGLLRPDEWLGFH